ncbi:hypothetical protein FKM82_018060 [Ascaphus truei]
MSLVLYVSLMYGTPCPNSLDILSLLPLPYQSELRPIGNHDNGCIHSWVISSMEVSYVSLSTHDIRAAGFLCYFN